MATTVLNPTPNLISSPSSPPPASSPAPPAGTATTSPSSPQSSPGPSATGSGRLFRSISRFLSGGNKSRASKLPPLPAARASTGNNGGGAGAGSNGRGRKASRGGRRQQSPLVVETPQMDLPLREVRSPSIATSTHSGRAMSESTTSSASYLRHDNSYLIPPSHSRRTRGEGEEEEEEEEDGEDSESFSGADTDASLRPISPNSMAPSRDLDDTSVISHAHSASTSTNATHRTHFSYASTKPTTLLSIDSGGGANRIAVVPPGQSTTSTSSNTSPILPNTLTSSSSGNSLSHSSAAPGITFSSLPSNSSSPVSPSSPTAALQAPGHSHPHPRNNPHPLSPPPDNASMLTLASSSFAPSIFHPRSSASVGGGGVSLLASTRGATRFGDREADEDASVRALAGSRRASEESLGSRSTWSAAVPRGSVREREGSLRTVGTVEDGNASGIVLPEEREKEETEAEKVVRKEGEKEEEEHIPLSTTTTTTLEHIPLSTTSTTTETNSLAQTTHEDPSTPKAFEPLEDEVVYIPPTPALPATISLPHNSTLMTEEPTVIPHSTSSAATETNGTGEHEGEVTTPKKTSGGKEREASEVSEVSTVGSEAFEDAKSEIEKKEVDEA